MFIIQASRNAWDTHTVAESLVETYGRRQRSLAVEQTQKTTTVKILPGHLYKHTAPSRELCIFKTCASSSQPASLTFSGPIKATTTSLIPKAQVHGFDFLFSGHLLCAGAIIYQQSVIVFIQCLLYVRQTPC